MKLTAKLTNLGIELSLHEDEVPGPLEPATDADQIHPRQYYVYAHLDSSGQVFYVGKGMGRRAWSTDRHPLWYRYVDNHLNGVYQVRILHDNLSAENVEEVEAEWIAQCSDTVVNWFNMGRETDFEALDRRNNLRAENLSLIQQAKAIEKNDMEKAASIYIQAIEAIQAYAFITYEKGLVGQLLEEEAAELGVCGEVNALDRLTICLIKLGRPTEAAEHTDKYFALYRRDLQFGIAGRIVKRVDKAIARMQKPNKPLHRTPKSGRL
jgi:tetratricopeptide (TPR) repeat protein